MLKKFVLAISLFIIATLFCVSQSNGLVMGPARFEASLPPGEIADCDYYVQNDTDHVVHIIVEPENWFKDIYKYGKLDIKDWIEFDSYEFDLKPKEIKKLRLRIKVPVDVKGELVAQIFFTSTVMDEKGEPIKDIKARVGGVLYVAIKGTEIMDAEIKEIAVLKESSEGIENFKAQISVNNKGNVHIRPEGKIFIEDESGKIIKTLVLKAGSPTLPKQQVEYHASWDNADIKEGVYKIFAIIRYGKDINLEKTTKLIKRLKIDKDGKALII